MQFKPDTIHWIYGVMVIPVLGCGATIWLNGTKAPHKLLNGVQRLSNTPGTAVDVITGNPPITLWLEEESAKGAVRLENHNHWQHSPISEV